jgi:transposase
LANASSPRPVSEKKSIHAAEQHRPDVQEKRQAWPQVVREHSAKRLIFIDETGCSTAMARLYGYAPKGQRLVDAVPHGHWNITTFIGGLTTRGLIAPWVFSGAMNADTMVAYIEKNLARETRPGDLVILDNLTSHKTASVRMAFEKAGIRTLYLPPYSPDFNPIEMAFAKLKAMLQREAERTMEGLWNAIGRLIDRFTPQQCKNFFRHAGYATYS